MFDVCLSLENNVNLRLHTLRPFVNYRMRTQYLEYFDHRRTPWKCFDFVFQMWSRIENLTNMKRLFHFYGYVSFISHGEKKLKI